MRVDLHAFARPGAIGLAALLTVAAIVGKQVCALGGLGSTLDKITIGIGMIPRGEVGLIFANIGLGLVVHGERIVDDHIYSAVVIAVMVTTLVTPPALKWRLSRTSRSVQSV
jgi:Kef-type K+ transport system membrane component KefB